MRKLVVILLFFSPVLFAQQNQQMFQMHYLGESNFLNPAVQSECKWFIGIPVLSSIHMNYANSGFTYKQIINNTSDSTYSLNIDETVDKLGWRTLIGTEFHTTILALGHKRGDYYYTFSIIEKNNIPFTMPKDLFILAWEGNSPYEGETASLKGTSSFAMHYREYAAGLSKKMYDGFYLGAKAKLLFGKFNLASPKTDVTLHTDENTFDLTLDGDAKVNMSAPIIIEHAEGQMTDYYYDESVSATELIFNRKNWGLAIDAGFIYELTNDITVSGSILDFGFIRWRSYLNNVSFDEHYTYQGILADSGNVVESIIDSIYFYFNNDPYTTMLPLKMYLGAEYHVNHRLEARALVSAVAYRTKFSPALTLAVDYNPAGHFHVIGSYSVMYRSFTNVGLGFSVGRDPVQFYMISDNVLGLIWPLSARNINLRFGLNLNFGCREKENEKYRSMADHRGECAWIKEKNDPRKRKKKRK